MKVVLASSLFAAAAAQSGWGPSPSFDCAMRKLAYTYGKQLLPRMGAFESLYYALDLNDPTCKTPMVANSATAASAAATPVATATLPVGAKLFVHPTAGSDGSKSGAIDAPLRTVQEALNRAALIEPTPAVVLREGTHYIADSLLLTAAHSNLHMLGYPGETVTVSGGVELTNLDWKPYNVSGANIYVTSVKDDIGEAMTGLQMNGERATIARYPNQPGGVETSCGYGCVVASGDAEWTPPDFNKYGNVTYYTDLVPAHKRNDSADSATGLDNWFSHYMIGVNGLCSVYDPPVSYWCSECVTPSLRCASFPARRLRPSPIGPHSEQTKEMKNEQTKEMKNRSSFLLFASSIPDRSAQLRAALPHLTVALLHIRPLVRTPRRPPSRHSSLPPSFPLPPRRYTSGGGAFAFRTPSGITPKSGALPNAPYADASQALFFVWRPARWSNWMFEIDTFDAKTGTYAFGKGGNQGARGNDKGGDFYIQDVFEELDFPGEFFFNRSTKELFFFYNGTGAVPSDATFVVPKTQVLVNASGTQWKPVTNVKLENIVYTASAATYMERHAVPSAGDWALDRFSAVFLQGTEGATVTNCTFTRLDGNAVMVSGYNRNATGAHFFLVDSPA